MKTVSWKKADMISIPRNKNSYTITHKHALHDLPHFGSIDVTLHAVSSCGKKSLPATVMHICDEDYAPAPLINKATDHAQRGEKLDIHWIDTVPKMKGHIYKVTFYNDYAEKDFTDPTTGKYYHKFNHTTDVSRDDYCKGTDDNFCLIPVQDVLNKMVGDKEDKYMIFKVLSLNRCYEMGYYTNYVVYEKRECT